jgi:D-alanine-D-alanine ligase
VSDISRVCVLAGGLSVEREVSLWSGGRVCAALRAAGVDAYVTDADAGLLRLLTDDRPDAVFIALHGDPGEDGSLRGVLDLVGVPYVGASAHASRLAYDKPTAKSVVRSAGISTPEWLALSHATFRELGAGAVLERLAAHLGLPLMVKPASGGSALGASAVHRADDLPAALVNCFAYGETILVERFVTGREVAVTVIDAGDGDDPRALPAVEIEVLDGMYDYAARYTEGTTCFYTPARLAPDVAARAAKVAVTAHVALGLSDLSRTDCIVDGTGTVQFLEVNVSPGMTETSLVPLAVAAAGLDLGVLCRDLLRRASERHSRS